MSSAEAQQKIQARKHPHQSGYKAMYSSWCGGIIKDPAWMVVPIDDHLVHRGDGVFEAMKAVHGKIYLLPEHLERLFDSAQKLSLKIPATREELTQILQQTWQASGLEESILRLYVSRGPGTFSANPYDSLGAQIYVVATEYMPPAAAKYTQGVRIGRSQIVPKEDWLAQIKTCNYLPNVMMKKESIDRQLDFTIGFGATGFVTESSTENIFIVTQDGFLQHPPFRQILKGTVMLRSFALAQSLVGKEIKGVRVQEVSEADLLQAQEVMIAGTTWDILPVVAYEGQPIGRGQPGPVATRLLQLIRQDQR